MSKILIIASAAIFSLTLAACDSAPSEESPVAPSVVCEQGAQDEACPQYDKVVTDEAIKDGEVVTEGDIHNPRTEDEAREKQ